MSQIKAIIDAISAVSVGTETQTPTVYDVDNAISNLKGTPARIVFVLPMGTNEGRDTRWVTSTTMVTTWDIADLLLYDRVKKGSTIHTATPELVGYVSNYLAAFKSKVGLLSGVTIENIEAEWDVIEYPPESGNEYYGCLMTLTVKEIIQ